MSAPNAQWAVVAVVLVGGIMSGGLSLMIDGRVEATPAASEIPPTPEPQRTGQVSISSIPSGALVRVNGEAIRLDNGTYARTPIGSLTYLEYGRRYTIEVDFEGPGVSRETFVMDAQNDGRHLSFELEHR